MDSYVWGRIGLVTAIAATGTWALLAWVERSDPLHGGPVLRYPAYSDAALNEMAAAAGAPPAAPPPRPQPAGPALAPADLPAVTFADGVTARVLKVERHADGERFMSVLHPDDRSLLLGREEPANVVVVTVRFDDAQQPADEQDHLVRIDGRLAGSWRRGPQIAVESRAVVEAAAVVDAGVDRIAVELAAAVGPFTLSQRFAPGDVEGQTNPGTERAPLQIVGLIPRQRALVVECEPGGASPEPMPREPGHSWLFQAVCRDGRRVPATMRMESSATGPVIGFRVPSKDVERVEYRYRPYAWGTVGDVALPPVAATQVAVAGPGDPVPTVPQPGR